MKLVRDRIPDIINSQGKVANTYIANDEDYKKKLKEKLSEEVTEFLESESVEELADIMEVIYALGEVQSLSPEELEKIRKKKVDERGAFKKKIILR